jgi:hypothetical protein
MRSSSNWVVVVLGEDLVVFVELGENLEVVDVVLVGFHVKSEVHSCELVHLAEVDVVPKVVASELSFLLPVLVESLLKFFKLLHPLKDVSFFRFHVVCLYQLNVLSIFSFSKVGHCFLLYAPLSFDEVDLLLKALAVFIFLRLEALFITHRSVTIKLVLSLGLLILSCCSMSNWQLWEEVSAIFREDPDNPISWLRSNREPVSNLMLVEQNPSRNSFSASGHPVAHSLNVPSLQVLLVPLDDNVPKGVVANSTIAELKFSLHDKINGYE